MATLIDSYVESNLDTPTYLYAGGIIQEGQSFATSDSLTLDSCKFYIYKAGNPTGNVLAKVYAHDGGTYGSTGLPTGSVLATSVAVDATTVPGSWTLVTFSFTGVNRILLDASTHYVLILEYSGGNVSSAIGTSLDTSSPTHGGSRIWSSNGTSWTAQSGHDMVFYVYGVVADVNEWEQPLDDTFTLSDDNAGLPTGHNKSLDDTFALSDDGAASRIPTRPLVLADVFVLGDSAVPVHHSSSSVKALSDVFTLSDQSLANGVPAVVIPPVFPIEPNGGSTISFGYLTDIIGPAEDGHEQRVQLRGVPVREITYEWADLGTREAQLLASLLCRSEAEWVVPFWPHFVRSVLPLALNGTKVYVPTGWTATSPFLRWSVEATDGELYVVLWTSPWVCEARVFLGSGTDGGGEYLSVAPGAAAPAGILIVPGTLGQIIGSTPRSRFGPDLKTGGMTFRSKGTV